MFPRKWIDILKLIYETLCDSVRKNWQFSIVSYFIVVYYFAAVFQYYWFLHSIVESFECENCIVRLIANFLCNQNNL